MIDSSQLGYATPQSAYGFSRPNLAVAASTQVDSSTPGMEAVSGPSLTHHSVGWNNPLFWLVVLVLIVIGYIGFMFDVSFKRVGEAKIGTPKENVA